MCTCVALGVYHVRYLNENIAVGVIESLLLCCCICIHKRNDGSMHAHVGVHACSKVYM